MPTHGPLLTPFVGVGIRWMVRRDLADVLAIEHASFGDPWGEEGLLALLRRPNVIGMVAEHRERTLGWMVYALHRDRIDLLRLAVDPFHLREGIGSMMAAKLAAKLCPQRRTRVAIDVRERNLGAQLFFKAQGYRAAEVVRGHFADTGEDAYRMVHAVDRAEGGPA